MKSWYIIGLGTLLYVASFFLPVVYLQYNPQEPIGGMNIPYIEGGVLLFPAIFAHLTLAFTLMFYVGHFFS
jgi:hypothetical protein